MSEVIYNPIEAKVVAATRLTKFHTNGLISLEVLVPYYIWPEVLTHKRLARNAMSHRAAGIKRFEALGFYRPEVFYAQGQGMQSGEPLPEDKQELARAVWHASADASLQFAQQLVDIGCAKEQALRLLSPSHNVRGLLTGTEDAWAKVLLLRDHPAADRAMQELAQLVKEAIATLQWQYSDRHEPYMAPDELASLREKEYLAICGARVARVSYGKSEAKDNDLQLARRLISSGHLSPFEHIAVVGTAGPITPRSALYSKPEDESRGHCWVNLRAQLEQGYML